MSDLYKHKDQKNVSCTVTFSFYLKSKPVNTCLYSNVYNTTYPQKPHPFLDNRDGVEVFLVFPNLDIL